VRARDHRLSIIIIYKGMYDKAPRVRVLIKSPLMRLEEVVKLCPHLASQGGPRVVVRAVGVDQVTAGPVDHVVVQRVGEEPRLQ